MRTCFVTKSEDVFDILSSAAYTGSYIPLDTNLIRRLEDIETSGFFAERFKMENRQDFKQIIPCFMLRDVNQGTILIYQRKSTHTEGRLAGKWTPVFGGHIDPGDFEFRSTLKGVHDFLPQTFEVSLAREMLEETGIEYDRNNLVFESFIYDERNEVGRVHLGLLFSYYVDISRELVDQILSKPEVGNILIVTEEALEDFNDNSDYILEGWAQIALSNIISIEETYE